MEKIAYLIENLVEDDDMETRALCVSAALQGINLARADLASKLEVFLRMVMGITLDPSVKLERLSTKLPLANGLRIDQILDISEKFADFEADHKLTHLYMGVWDRVIAWIAQERLVDIVRDHCTTSSGIGAYFKVECIHRLCIMAQDHIESRAPVTTLAIIRERDKFEPRLPPYITLLKLFSENVKELSCKSPALKRKKENCEEMIGEITTLVEDAYTQMGTLAKVIVRTIEGANELEEYSSCQACAPDIVVFDGNKDDLIKIFQVFVGENSFLGMSS